MLSVVYIQFLTQVTLILHLVTTDKIFQWQSLASTQNNILL